MKSIGVYVAGFFSALAFAVACNGTSSGTGTDTDADCSGGEMSCAGECVDLSADEANCGACGDACADGERCTSGVCAASCPVGTEECGDQCVDLNEDSNHCGACGAACAADESCTLGECQGCGAGLSFCDGGCVDLGASDEHCGACDSACDPGVSCSAGTCGSSCESGELDCGGECVDPESDDDHCGACGNSCSIGQICTDGGCHEACADGESYCDSECVDTQSSAAHCGACGSACAGEDICVAGECAAPCGPGLAFCSDECVDLQSAPAHCGACESACEFPNASALCEAGACALGPCDAGWVNLDGDPATGCEAEAARRVFVSSKTYNGALGGVLGADSKCQQLADQAGIGGMWRAWLSDESATPATRFEQVESEIHGLDAAVVATSWADLVDGELSSPIMISEKGDSVGASIVWTNTDVDGTMPGADHCAGWTSSAVDVQGLSGKSGSIDASWTNQDLGVCNTKRRVYCFEL